MLTESATRLPTRGEKGKEQRKEGNNGERKPHLPE